MHEGAPLRRCANENCPGFHGIGRPFVHQVGRPGHDKFRRTAGVMYCSWKCAKTTAERDWQRKKRLAR
jgi:hypothetical protein